MHAISSLSFTIVHVYVATKSEGGAVSEAVHTVFIRGALDLSIPNTLATSLRFISYLCLIIGVKTGSDMIPAGVLIDPDVTYGAVHNTFLAQALI